MRNSKIVDFHTHILNGVDHGSTSLNMSIEQVKLLLDSGVDIIVSTSHYYPHKDELDVFLEIREKAYNELMNSLEKNGINADIRLGAEVLLCAGLDKLSGIDKLCISGTNTLLIELPFSDFRNEYLETLENLIEKGYDIILAHVDRYPIDVIEPLSYLKLKFQINASSLCTFVKRPKLYEWILRDLVVALGSDIHLLNKKAMKEFIKCSKKLKEDFGKIMQKSFAILNNEKNAHI